jgi:hypothetical protein
MDAQNLGKYRVTQSGMAGLRHKQSGSFLANVISVSGECN